MKRTTLGGAEEPTDFAAFFAMSADLICIAGFDGYFKLVNPAWEQTLGWTPEELTSRPWTAFVHPDDLQSTIAEAARQTEQGNQTLAFENRYVARDGSYRTLSWNSTPCNARQEMYAIARDVTLERGARQALIELNDSLEQQVSERTKSLEERVLQAEEARRNLNAVVRQTTQGADRLRYFLQHLPVCAATIDADMRYTFATDRFKEQFAPDRPIVLGALHTELFPGKDEKWGRAVARSLAGETLDAIEERVTLANGGEEWLSWRADPWATANGIRGMVFYAEVITARKEAENRIRAIATDLTRSNAELEAFTYSVSHDLKEPLRTIEAFSQVLLEDYAAVVDEQGKEYLRKVAAGSARMKRLIEDLLALSRIGKRDDGETPVDVNRVVADVIEGMRATIEVRSANVFSEPDFPLVLGDRSRVEQIFGNLIANGIKFNRSEHPRIEVGVRDATDECITFYVRDNGIGIDPAYHERVFGIFQRLHRREEFEGTGAGLAIVKRAVEALGGQIRVESDGERGSTFLFTLRAAPDTATLVAA
jgi:PAS domain S-box-containing protein